MRVLPVPALLAATLALPAQQPAIKPYQASPAATVSQDLGTASVKIEYSSPGVKGRQIWGGLVPWDKVWRAGANNATVFTFSDPVKIAGKDVPAGSYAFFAVPGQKSWKLILNKNYKQWGDYAYKAEEDVLAFEVVPAALTASQERLTYTLQVKDDTTLRAALNWEKVSVAFDITVDAPGLYWENLNKTLAGAYVPFLQGARYCLSNNVHLEQGLAWAEQSVRIRETYSNLDAKARLLAKLGRKAEAVPVLKKARELAAATPKIPAEYLEGLDKALAEWQAK